MKAFRCVLLATLMIGVLFSGVAPRTADAVISLRWICSSANAHWDPSTNTITAGCRYVWIDDGAGGGGAPTGGPSDYLGGGGGGVGSNTVPNKGDKTTVQRDPATKTTCDQAADPVVFSTGNEVMPEVNFGSAGTMGLSLTLTYNHYWNGIGIFGRRWLSDYDYKLLFTTHDPTSPCYTRPGNTPCNPVGKPIWALRPDGRLIKFNYSTTPVPGWYEDKPSPIAKIIKNGSTYTLYSEDHTVETYDAYGFPLVIQNQQGVSWTFSYDANHYLQRVTHSSGRHVDFGWTNGLLTSVTDPAGHVYRYGYTTISVTADTLAKTQSLSPMMLPPPDLDDPPPTPTDPPIQSMVALLTSITKPLPYTVPPIQTMSTSAAQTSNGSTTITYHYDDPRFVTALTGKSINGHRYSWITYNANARVVETKLTGNVERYQFAYTLNDAGTVKSAIITNPLGKKTTYQFNAKGNRTAVAGSASTHCPASYKALEYDANGYLSDVTDFSGNITLFTYAKNGQLQQEVRGAGTPAAQTISYVWDATYHRPTKITVEGDHSTSYSYNSKNRLTSVVVKNLSSAVQASKGQSHTTTYTYTTWPNGLVKTKVVDGPLAGSGDAITLSYSEAGDLLSKEDALGHTTTYGGYNALGMPGFVIGPNGNKRSFDYDNRGRLVDEQTHRNGGTQHTYYRYDGFGRLARVIYPDGHTRSYQYDIAGRLTAEYEPEGDGTFDETVYTYNAMSLPVAIKKQHVFTEPQEGTVQ